MNNESVDVVVVGQGYVGLPLAQEAVKSGLKTVGFDLSPHVVEGLNKGSSHIDDLSDTDVLEMIERGYLATSDPDVLSRASTVVICVPTPLTNEGTPEMSYVISAANSVGEKLAPGSLVCLESTTYPGTTEDLLRPLLENRGFTVGVDAFLAFSPERINPGDPVYGFRNTPKVVGGSTPECTERARHFYEKLVDTVVPVSSTKVAEMAKLLENTYRHVNIALVNELARACHGLGVNIFEVIEAAKSKPFGFQAFYPGPGVGGHCIPIDPNYLSYTIKTELGQPFRFVELAQEINNSMPQYVISRITDLLNEEYKAVRGSKILLLGVTYKADIADQRESPALPIGRLLLKAGADLQFHDPKISEWRVSDNQSLQRVHNLKLSLQDADIVVLLQAHTSYSDLGSIEGIKTILDTRGIMVGKSNVHTL